MLRITLTKAEATWAEWALDVMPAYFEERVADGDLASVPPLPRMDGRDLVFDAEPDVEALADLRYRLTEQAPDATDAEPNERRAAAGTAAALRAWRKIRDAAKVSDTDLR